MELFTLFHVNERIAGTRQQVNNISPSLSKQKSGKIV
jgi:hypothetical protein